MSEPLSPQEQNLLSSVPADGTTIGNQTLRERLGWTEADYATARDALVARGMLEKGKGRGGSVRRTMIARAGSPAVELFPAAEVESFPPDHLFGQRGGAAPAPAAKKAAGDGPHVTEHRHAEATRKNLPAAGDALGHVDEAGKITYAYDPHRPPVLRFNEAIVRQRELLEKATRQPLAREEAVELAAMLESPQPWLEWAGKREQPSFDVDPVALHIHERVSAQAILHAVRREDIQRDLFADTTQNAREARAYYQHDVAWANRLIVGDSLQVMTSLARREGLAGQVQMIYFDPPYGIKFSSNWQNEVGKRDVKDKDEDLTREPEMIKAYRDTWTLGVHSYLAYIKQRLIVARELLSDSGSIFVQISEENLHRVRALLDEVFGAENSITTIVVKKKANQKGDRLESICDYILFYAKEKVALKYHHLFLETDHDADAEFSADLTGGGVFKTQQFEVNYADRVFRPGAGNSWKTNEEGVGRLLRAERIRVADKVIRYRRFKTDFGFSTLTNIWEDTGGASDRVYVVQTATKVIQRCVLMATDPGDIVLDPTCGSGTSAFVAEQWGRRWVTIDSSRVAIAIARQRVLTACFDAYKSKDPVAGVDPGAPQNPRHGFHYKTVPHITLKSIAQNKGLDPIFANHEPVLAVRLAELNAALAKHPTPALRQKLVGKLIAKLRANGARTITDADQRRWLFPSTDPQLIQTKKGGPTVSQMRDLRDAIPPTVAWRDWEIPFDTDPDWPEQLQTALTAYRTAWRAKMDEVNKAIEASADQEELVDQPEPVRGVVRVAGPFTVESVRPPEASLKGESEDDLSPIGGTPSDELESAEMEAASAPERDVSNAASHIDRMLSLLRHDGVTHLGNKHRTFSHLDRVESSFLHAEGEFAADDGRSRRVAVVIGPEFGSITSFQVDNALRAAHRRGYDELIFAGFSIDAAAQETIQAYNDEPRAEVRIHMAQIRPDVSMGDLLKKTQVTAQIFTVFGQPRTRIEVNSEGEYVVHMEGVDIYDPVKNAIDATSAAKVAAWFLDTDYDGRVFCTCQAFFPDKSAWEKLARALKTSVEEGTFEALTIDRKISLPFMPGPRQCVAVKVIDPRGNEVMRVHRLDGTYTER